ncbi:MAG: hypothetical protein C0501_08850 [Isosphaera sp.]|nr:hypothetical protein [Isosphaera sp.]
MSARACLSAAAVLLAAAAPAAAQPDSPLRLVRGIREAGMPDLALEYLADVEKRLSPADQVLVPLERARCQLDAAEDEPDEGTRAGMVNAAKVGFNTFLASAPKHPRAAEASLSLARLTAVEAKAQLNRARRMDIPPAPPADAPDRARKEAERDRALKLQREEADKARPLFQRASGLFADAAALIKTRLEDKSLDPVARQALEREKFDADLAAAINVYNQADTVLATGAKVGLERNALLERAQKMFAELAKGPVSSRTVWVARAWMGELLGDMGRPKDQEAEFAAIVTARQAEADEGRRLVQFFQVRRLYLDALREGNPTKLPTVVTALRGWLARHGNLRKPTPEALATRYYLAFTLEQQALFATAKLKPNPATGVVDLPGDARRQYEEAERLYRALTQSDHDYTARATQHRMFVVRRLIGEADKPASEYATFETAQMASLIQMAKLADAEAVLRAADEPDENDPFWAGARAALSTVRVAAEVKDRKVRVVALLERARELATDKDAPADVADTLLRLVYFYQTTDQPHQAAVLGEHVARTVRAAGGKGARAGLLALFAFTAAAPQVRAEAANDPEAQKAVEALRAVDRRRAIAVATFVDEAFPKDPLADAVRHRLALLLAAEGQTDAAFEAAAKVGPGYADALTARQLQAALAGAIVRPDSPAPADRKKAVFGRAVADLSRVPRPAPNASEADVRGYLGCRLRLAGLYLLQARVDPGAEAKAPGYGEALRIADEALAAVGRFDELVEKGKGLNLDGLDLHAQALELRTRTLFLQARTQADAGKADEAAAAVEAAAADAARGPVLDDRARKLTQPADTDPPEAATQKARVQANAVAVDRFRQDIILVGFKLRCLQGNVKEAQAMLDRLKGAGGVEGNQKALEGVTRELAAKIADLKKQGMAKEADGVGAGLALLIKEVSALPKLESTTVLFLGQTLAAVGRYDEAVAEFKKIPVPSEPDWPTRNPDEYPQEKRGQILKEIREYRFAQLSIAKAYRGGGKFAEAEALLTGAIGAPDKQGYAYRSLDFKKELATLYEAKGAAAADPKAAGAEWGKAMREWTALTKVAQAVMELHQGQEPKLPDPAKRPPDAEKEKQAAFDKEVASFPDRKKGWDERRRQLQGNYLDAFFETNRVEVAANTQLVKAGPRMDATYERVVKSWMFFENSYKLAEQEAKGEGVVAPAVRVRYADLLDAHPGLKAAYKAAGGKFFLDRPKPAD